jgi:hypothetical protein
MVLPFRAAFTSTVLVSPAAEPVSAAAEPAASPAEAAVLASAVEAELLPQATMDRSIHRHTSRAVSFFSVFISFSSFQKIMKCI